MIKVLVVNVQSQGGGAEAALANLINTVVTGKFGLQIDSFSKDRFDEKSLSPNKIIGYIRFLLALRYRGKGYDFVVSGVEGIPFLLCALAFIGLNKPRLVMWLHCSPSEYLRFQTLKNRTAIRASLKISKNIICAAWTEVDNLKKIGKNASYLPNIRHSRQKVLPVIPTCVLPKFAFVGSLAVLKQPLKTVDIMLSLLKKGRTDCHLDIYGTGPLLQELNSEIDENQLCACVKVHGFVSDPWQMIEPGSILLLPSLTEATPMVVLEAFDRGCVVMSNVYKGYKFFSEHGGLFIGIDFSNIDLVMSAIYDAFNWSPAELATRVSKSRSFIRDRFNASDSLCMLHDFLEKIASTESVHEAA